MFGSVVVAFFAVAITSTNAGGNGTQKVSLVNSGDWSGCANFMQNLFGSDQSQKSMPMINIIPTSMQNNCDTGIVSTMKSIKLSICETEMLSVIGVIKGFIQQLSSATATITIKSWSDFYGSCQKGAPNLTKLWGQIYALFTAKWGVFKSKLQGTSLQCVNDSVTLLQQKYTSCWSQTSQAFYQLPQSGRDDVADACGSLSPTIRDVYSLPQVRSYFNLSANVSASGSIAVSG